MVAAERTTKAVAYAAATAALTAAEETVIVVPSIRTNATPSSSNALLAAKKIAGGAVARKRARDGGPARAVRCCAGDVDADRYFAANEEAAPDAQIFARGAAEEAGVNCRRCCC